MSRFNKHLTKWNKIKSKGLFLYILKTGILYYGLLTFLIWVFLVPFIDSQFTLEFLKKETFEIRFITFAIISPLLGMLVSYIWWKSFEREFE